MSENENSLSSTDTAPSEESDAAGIARIMREPLLHFLLLGSTLFGLYACVTEDNETSSDPARIIVSEGKIEHLAALFTRTWQRPPTRQELRGLVEDYVREEAAYREGTALALDRNDTIIRRRIRQKLEFVADDLASQLQPSEENLEQYRQSHPDKFRVDSRLTFRQVYFDPSKHGEDLDAAVGELAQRLQEDSSVQALEQGNRTLLEFLYKDISQREVANLFGEQFAEALADLKPGQWRGPVGSSYGTHAVIVDKIVPGELPPLDRVRESVRREWEHDRRTELTEIYYQGLLAKYDIVIQWPGSESER